MKTLVQSMKTLVLLSGLSIAMSCGVGHRLGSDPTLLWLWWSPAATALIRPLALELPYAEGAALKSKKRKKRRKACIMVLNLHTPAPMQRTGSFWPRTLYFESAIPPKKGVPVVAQWLKNPTNIHEDLGSFPGLAQ